jgi:hypothetical protein
MKRLLLTLLWAMIATLPLATRAQVFARMPVAAPPSWAPPGYTRAQYYYLPDLQVYYDVPAASFLLSYRGQWIALRQLPPMYRSYDLYAAPKVVLDYQGPSPYRHYEVHRQRFPRWYCPPHSVIVYRDAPAPAALPRRYPPGRRYRHHDDSRYDRRYDDACDGRCTHEHHPGPGDGDRPYNPNLRNEDDPYPPQIRDGEPEREYDYYGQEGADGSSPRGNWR